MTSIKNSGTDKKEIDLTLNKNEKEINSSFSVIKISFLNREKLEISKMASVSQHRFQ